MISLGGILLGIKLDVEIGPHVFKINCQVLDIKSRYNLILGRPWIHTTSAVPFYISRYIVNDELVTILSKDQCSRESLSCIELDAEVEPSTFQTKDVIHVYIFLVH